MSKNASSQQRAQQMSKNASSQQRAQQMSKNASSQQRAQHWRPPDSRSAPLHARR